MLRFPHCPHLLLCDFEPSRQSGKNIAVIYSFWRERPECIFLKGWGSKGNLHVLRCVCVYACVCTHVHVPNGEIILLDDLGLPIKNIYNYNPPPFCHALTFQNPYVVTDMGHQLPCRTCEFNRGKFRRNRSNLPVYFHQEQHHHVNAFPKLMVRLDFSKWMIESPGCRQAWWAQVAVWKLAPPNPAHGT